MALKRLYGFTLGNGKEEWTVDETLENRLELGRTLNFDGAELRFNISYVRDIKKIVKKADSLFNHNNLHLSINSLNLLKKGRLKKDFLEDFVNVIGHYNIGEDIVTEINSDYIRSLRKLPKFKSKRKTLVELYCEEIIPIDFCNRLLIENGSRPENNLRVVSSIAEKLGTGVTIDIAHVLIGFYEWSEGEPHDRLTNYAWFKNGSLTRFKKQKIEEITKRGTHFHISGVKLLNLGDGVITWDCHYPLNKITTKSKMKRETLKQIIKYAPIKSYTIELRKEFQKPKELINSPKYFEMRLMPQP